MKQLKKCSLIESIKGFWFCLSLKIVGESWFGILSALVQYGTHVSVLLFKGVWFA